MKARRFLRVGRGIGLALVLAVVGGGANGRAGSVEPLRVGVYATAGGIQQYLGTPAGRERALAVFAPLHITHIFLEGRRGDEYVGPAPLRELRDFFERHGIACSGGIATVPGPGFGERQTGGLDWLNWESERTRAGVRGFFTENAPVFPSLIVDDFYCTGDESAAADRARGTRSWSQYRRDLLVSSIPELITGPARRAHPGVRLFLKFPQWYDRFHVFGYDPARMPAWFDEIWVGTEVRNPETRRMGYVQPTEGYMNFRWLTSATHGRTRGAWFDHIECSAENFLDQAVQSVLAGARELTLFHLGDLMEGHPGDALLANRLAALSELSAQVRRESVAGVAYYKPPGGDGDENLYLADYLGMVGLPIVPVAEYPEKVPVTFLPVQAAGDAGLMEKARRSLRRGGVVVCTPALVRALGAAGEELAGVKVGPAPIPSATLDLRVAGRTVPQDVPLEIDQALQTAGAETLIALGADGGAGPWLTTRRVGAGRLLVLNVRTFSAADFGRLGEWLLAPLPRGLSRLPQAVADELRRELLAPLGIWIEAPTRVGVCLFQRAACLYNFQGTPVDVQLNGKNVVVPPHDWRWMERR